MYMIHIPQRLEADGTLVSKDLVAPDVQVALVLGLEHVLDVVLQVPVPHQPLAVPVCCVVSYGCVYGCV